MHTIFTCNTISRCRNALGVICANNLRWIKPLGITGQAYRTIWSEGGATTSIISVIISINKWTGLNGDGNGAYRGEMGRVNVCYY